jgi:uncharacterized protein (TIGR02996 family)
MQTEAEAFLQRIRAYPDDDTPRLIFADWLEEQSAGFPAAAERARFIRVQIALARLEEDLAASDDSFAVRCEQEEARRKLVHEERVLLDHNREDWISLMRDLATGHQFRRGFVEEVNVDTKKFVRHAHELFDVSPLRHIHLLEVPGNFTAALQCHYLSRLNALTIHGTHIGAPLAQAVGRSSHLANLKVLHLSRNRFEDDSAEHLAASTILANLVELNLWGNELGETGARALAASPYMSTIRILELHENRLGPTGAEALATSERMGSLRILGLARNEIGSARLQSLTRIHALLRVPILDLSMNSITAAGLHVILTRPPGPADPALVGIRELDLSHNEFGSDGARVIAACPNLANVRILRLASCAIGDDGARAIAESPHLNQLVSLDLRNNPINDAGCQAFLNTQYMRSLRDLRPPELGVSHRMQQRLRLHYQRNR